MTPTSRPCRPLDVVVWTNEEGSRFQPATMGSAVFVGALSLAEVLAVTDAQGATVANALDQTLRTVDVTVKRPLGFAMHAYLEAHIEQGPLLEATGKQLGIVVGIQGMRWYEVVVSGAEGHAGTTPSANRRDALAAAVDMAQALRLHMADVTDSVRFTIGRFNVTPNSPNTIPGRVLFTVDLRHPEAVELARLGDAIGDVCRAHAGPVRCRGQGDHPLRADVVCPADPGFDPPRRRRPRYRPYGYRLRRHP